MADQTKISIPEILTAKNLGSVSEALDKVLQQTAVGVIDTAIGKNYLGINHRQQPGAVSVNKDHFGLTFFTRPRMNLTSGNLRAVRKFLPLLTNIPDSKHRIIRCLLDTELGKKDGITTQFVDRQQAFIPILTNNLISMGGWPDVTLPYSTSPAGVYGEMFSMADGVTDIFYAYDITANFRNLPGDPITLLFLIWVHYASLVYQGVLVPYPDMIIQNEIDYQTRIYRLVLDATKTRVQKIAATGVCFPVTAPIGASFNFESDRPINSSNDQIAMTFHAIGAIYNDDILVDEFNRTAVSFNSTLGDESRGQYYQQVLPAELSLFNMAKCYPRIDPDTYELQWFVSKDEYAELLPARNEQVQNKKGTING